MSQPEKHDEAVPAPPNASVRARLEVDWEGLAVAFENQLPESHSYLDVKTGRVHTVVTSAASRPEPPGAPEDYLYIPPRPSREGYRTMQHFLERMEDPALKEKLAATLVGKGAFRRFKDLLLDYPEVRQQWFAFKDAEVYTYIREWLSRERIEASNVPPPSTSKERIPVGRPRQDSRRAVAALAAVGGSGETNWQAAIAPYDRPGVIFRPGRTALLLIDLQRAFTDPQGSSFLPAGAAMTARLAALLQACRQAGIPVIFTRHVHTNPREDGGAMARWWKSLILEGHWESQLQEPFVPRNGERVITKSHYSAFAGTELLWVLRALSVEDVLIGGVMTNLCCETTARDAFINDFNVFFLGDGTATADGELQLSTLRNVAYGFGRVLSVAETLDLLKDRTQAVPVEIVPGGK